MGGSSSDIVVLDAHGGKHALAAMLTTFEVYIYLYTNM